MQQQEVSRARITDKRINKKLKNPIGKEQIQREKLPGNYVAGFVDGEGSFSISIGKDTEYKRGVQVRAEFEIELRADDQEILERILITIGCGRIYDCSYDRYGWYPHSKYKVTGAQDMIDYVFPFFDKHKLQAKKAKVYELFKEVVLMYRKKEHLTDAGYKKVVALRDEMRTMGRKHNALLETARIRENRSSGGVRQITI